jgi:hypothetical protein
MGILYTSVIKQKLHQEKMHKYFIDGLVGMGITESQLGHKVQDLDYEEAKYECLIATFKRADIENEK